MILANPFNIRISQANGKTQSRFGAKKDKEVVFHNESNRELTIGLNRDNVLCENGVSITSFFVAPGGHRVLTICRDCEKGTEVKYTAQLKGLLPEDPIIIIE
ncbi:MAG: hypothetical protein ACT4O5_12820 [Gammaproteobacteria bacterium]